MRDFEQALYIRDLIETWDNGNFSLKYYVLSRLHILTCTISVSFFHKYEGWSIDLLNMRAFLITMSTHYENTLIQIYRKFHLQKLKIFRYKTLIFFHISAQCFWAEIRKIMYAPVNPSFTV